MIIMGLKSDLGVVKKDFENEDTHLKVRTFVRTLRRTIKKHPTPRKDV
jgi:hypothetical protein